MHIFVKIVLEYSCSMLAILSFFAQEASLWALLFRRPIKSKANTGKMVSNRDALP